MSARRQKLSKEFVDELSDDDGEDAIVSRKKTDRNHEDKDNTLAVDSSEEEEEDEEDEEDRQFIDDDEEDGEGEDGNDDDDDDSVQPTAPKGKRKASETAARRPDRANDSSAKMNGAIADSSNEESEEGDEEEEEDLDEEDLELIEENVGLKPRQSAAASAHSSSVKSGFKRLRRRVGTMIDSDDEGEDQADGNRKRPAAATAPVPKAGKDLENLFEDDEDGQLEDTPGAATTFRDRHSRGSAHGSRYGNYEEEDEEEDEDDDDLAGFIEDDEEDDDDDEGGAGNFGREGSSSAYSSRQEREKTGFAARDPNRFIVKDEDDDENIMPRHAKKQGKSTGAASSTMAGLRRAFGAGLRVSPEAWQDMLEVFGDGTEYANALKAPSSASNKKAAARAGLAALPDNVSMEVFLQTCDLPERIARQGTKGREIKPGELEAEASWISGRFFAIFSGKFADPSLAVPLASAIHSVLRFIREQSLEIPFIATHRKEYFQHIIGLNELWAIWEEDERWAVLTRRREKVLQRLEAIDGGIPDRAALTATIHNADNELLLSTCHEYLRQNFAPSSAASAKGGEDEATPSPVPRPTGYNGKVGQSSALWQSFCLSPAQFASNLQAITASSGMMSMDTLEFVPVDPEETDPVVFLTNFVANCSGSFPVFSNPEQQILPFIIQAAAQELASTPVSFAAIKIALERLAGVNVRPTAKGLREVTNSHELAGMKYITMKPIGAFSEEQFLLLQRAEATGDLMVEVAFDEKGGSASYPIRSVLLSAYSPQGSHLASAVAPNGEALLSPWDEIRLKILEMAIERHVISRVKADISMRLKGDAERWVAQYCQYYVQDKLMGTPACPLLLREHESGRRNLAAAAAAAQKAYVVALSWGSGQQDVATMGVCVDQYGRVVDQCKLANLQNARNPEKQAAGIDALCAFIHSHSPRVILISGTTPETRNLHALVQQEAKRVDPAIVVLYGEDDTARIYENSPRSLRDFAEYSPLLRYCVSVARRFVDPLAELGACTDDELLQLPLHHLQGHIPRDTRLKYIHRAFVNVVNLVGIDINDALVHPRYRPLLKYVAGLGPIKADSLVKQLFKRGMLGETPKSKGGSSASRHSASGGASSSAMLVVTSRAELAECLPKRVYANCASFFRIRPSTISAIISGDASQPFTDPLDDTRIHPENYDLARKMAADALELEDDAGDDSHDTRDSPIATVMQQPEKLNDLLLDEYAKELERRLHVPKHLTLLDIKAELQSPYVDPRVPNDPAAPASGAKGDSSNAIAASLQALQPSEEVIFEMLTGETERTLFVGQKVMATVVRVADRQAICRLDSGLMGTLPGHAVGASKGGNFTSAPSLSQTLAALKQQQVIMAAVTEINLERLSVTLSLLPTDLAEPAEPRNGRDTYYDPRRAQQDARELHGVSTGWPSKEGATAAASIPSGAAHAKAATAAAPLASAPRYIAHPAFRPITRTQAEKTLADAMLGEVILRPSYSKGPGHLALTWKVDDGLFQHIELVERDKPNEWSLGKTLLIGDERYEDYDEIVARHIEPIVGYLQEARRCPKFFRNAPPATSNAADSLGAVEEALQAEKAVNPARIAYCLSFSHQQPGALLLSYLPGTKVYHELIHVAPTGFRFRRQLFERLDVLIGWFKQHARDAAPGSSGNEHAAASSAHRNPHHSNSGSSHYSSARASTNNATSLPPTSHAARNNAHPADYYRR